MLGLWLLGAVIVDGYAHLNRPEMETFFNPWHTALYSGLGAVALWVTFVVLQVRRPGSGPRRAIPAGYWGTLVGIGLFSLGGFLDLAWHKVFGIEVALDALTSTGVRSQGADRSDVPLWLGPAVLSMVLMTTLVAFFLLYTSAFTTAAPVQECSPTPEGSPGHEEAEQPVVTAVAS